MDAIKLSALVVSCNEARLLPRCLAALSFCDEICVVDLCSSDGSADVARELGARVWSRARVPIAEQVRREAVPALAHDWVVLCDPDETYPRGAGEALRGLIAAYPDAAAIEVPVQYRFRGQPVTTTFWSRISHKLAVFHRARVTLKGDVHRGIVAEPHAVARLCAGPAGGPLVHDWVEELGPMFEKHWRYLRHEGAAQHAVGRRFSWRAMARDTARTLHQNLFALGGARGGPTGLFLSAFYTGYVALGWWSLRVYQRQRGG